MAETLENINIEKPEQYAKEVGVSIPAEKFRPFNTARAKLAELKNEIDALTDEGEKMRKALALMESSQTQAIAPAVAATVAGAAVSGGIVADAVKDTKSEIRKNLGIFGIMFSKASDLDPKEMAQTAKDLLKEGAEAKGFGGIFTKLWVGFQLKIIGSKMGQMGGDFSKILSPEELAKLGLSLPTPSSPRGGVGETAEKAIDRYTTHRIVFRKLLLEDAGTLPYDDILDKNLMKDKNIRDLKEAHEKKWYDGLLQNLGFTPDEKKKKAMENILTTLFSGKKSDYILEAYNSAKSLPKNTPFPLDEKFSVYIGTASKVLKKMSGIAKAAMTHSTPEAGINYDERKNEVSMSDTESEVLSLFGGDRKMALFLFGSGSDLTTKLADADQTVNTLETWNAFKELYTDTPSQKKAKETVKRVFDYGKKFFEVAASNPDIALGMDGPIREIMNSRDFRFKSLAYIYTMLDGKDISNFANFSTIEKAQVYSIIVSLFQSESSNYNKGKLTSDYFTALNNSSRPIPQGVKQFFEDAAMYAGKKGVDALAEGGKYIAGLASSNPRIAAIFAAMNVPFIPARNSVMDFLIF